VTIQRVEGIESVEVRGTVDGIHFCFRARSGEWCVEIGVEDPWVHEGGVFTSDEVADFLARAFGVWRAQRGLTDSRSRFVDAYTPTATTT
jgi:hypothetical protein